MGDASPLEDSRLYRWLDSGSDIVQDNCTADHMQWGGSVLAQKAYDMGKCCSAGGSCMADSGKSADVHLLG